MTTKLDRRRFAKAIKTADTTTIKTLLARYPDIVLQTIPALCEFASDSVTNLVIDHVANTGGRILYKFAETMLVIRRVDIFIALITRVTGDDKMRTRLARLPTKHYVHCWCVYKTIATRNREVFAALLPYSEEMQMYPFAYEVCLHGLTDWLPLLLDCGLNAKRALHYVYQMQPCAKAVDCATALMQVGDVYHKEWFEFIFTQMTKPSPVVVQTAFRVLETRDDIGKIPMTVSLIRALLDAGLPRETLARVVVGGITDALSGFDAARDAARSSCSNHMPNVLGDVVASYLP